MGHAVSVMLRCGRERNVFKGEVHDFLQNFMVYRVRGAGSNGRDPRFVR